MIRHEQRYSTKHFTPVPRTVGKTPEGALGGMLLPFARVFLMVESNKGDILLPSLVLPELHPEDDKKAFLRIHDDPHRNFLGNQTHEPPGVDAALKDLEKDITVPEFPEFWVSYGGLKARRLVGGHVDGIMTPQLDGLRITYEPLGMSIDAEAHSDASGKPVSMLRVYEFDDDVSKSPAGVRYPNPR